MSNDNNNGKPPIDIKDLPPELKQLMSVLMFVEYMNKYDFVNGLEDVETTILDEVSESFISTKKVPDGHLPYETAVKHKNFKNKDDKNSKHNLFVVGHYKTVEEAREGHKHWVSVLKRDYKDLPDMIFEVQNNDLIKMIPQQVFVKKKA